MKDLALVLSFLAILASAAVADVWPRGDDPKDPRLTPDQFAILAWGWTSGDAQVFEDIRACGFNLAGFVAPAALDLAAKAGLKAIVSDPSIHVDDAAANLDDTEIAGRVKTLTERVKSHPAVWGYYLRDEPGAPAFPGLARWSAALRKADPKGIPYINLFPNYLDESLFKAWGVGDYEGYVESFVNTVHPAFISYDHYALMDDGTLRGGFFENLEAVRRVALRHGLPFWNIVLANSHFHYAEPTPAGLRFQAYTTLAYGARGISWFTYFAPNAGNYRLAPVDQFGHKTPTWDMLRGVNLQIHRLGPAYIKLKSVNVFHTADVPPGCNGPQSAVHVKKASGGSLLVGEFTDPDGKPWAIVVNKDLHRSTPFSIDFKVPGAIHMVNAYTGGLTPWSGENNWLAAGQGMLLTVK